MIARQLKASPDSQIILKEYWKKLQSGGMILEYRIDNYGADLLELANLKDVVPGVQFYIQNPLKPYMFTPHTFHHTVNYTTIQEFHKAKRIWKPAQKQSTP